MARVSIQSVTQQNLINSIPLGIVIVNCLGSFLLGFVFESFQNSWMIKEETNAFLILGSLSSFTTVSVFSAAMAELLFSNEICLAGLLIFCSVILSIFGFTFGRLPDRLIFQ